jgi:hypothetical protein
MPQRTLAVTDRRSDRPSEKEPPARMSSTNLKPGGEIDAFCTQCKADRAHRIIAIFNGVPKKVECLSCKGHHLYRPTTAQKEAAAAHRRASRGDKPAAAGTKTTRTTKASAVASKKREEDLVASWERAVAGKDYALFKAYRIDLTFSKGELIRHTKFGDGVVATVLDALKVEVLFRDGPRMLAQSRTIAAPQA